MDCAESLDAAMTPAVEIGLRPPSPDAVRTHPLRPRRAPHRRLLGAPVCLSLASSSNTVPSQRVVPTEQSACSSPKCLYAFRDRTRNHSGRYCSPRCGSRMSMQALRERNKEDRA
ncbi:CGNR zinc finger domain-containing protein [Streptomyces sp. NPDC093228]|uniref:CGNR zinc finger domain-containing protein n=1 Tax=Streptomyces sp. NPDC093228 TaxID=3155070 RepID=UPI00341D6EFF